MKGLTVNLPSLKNARRLLFSVPLHPMQGTRFQPTGFPDLGAATYQAGETDCLLVESAQSMANRLEATIWDEQAKDVVPALKGLSYVRVEKDKNEFLTSSIIEAHRINSPYIIEGKGKAFLSTLQGELEVLASGPIDRTALARVLFKYDANALLHGVFLAKKELAGGRLRLSRSLSAFIEASGVGVATSGGVKNDHVNPSGDASKGFGNVPFHREEFTARSIKAFVSLDLDQLRGYGLNEQATELLMVLAMYKIRRLFDGGLRLRTACDLAIEDGYAFKADAPADFVLPTVAELEKQLPSLIAACKEQLAGVTVVNFKN